MVAGFKDETDRSSACRSAFSRSKSQRQINAGDISFRTMKRLTLAARPTTSIKYLLVIMPVVLMPLALFLLSLCAVKQRSRRRVTGLSSWYELFVWQIPVVMSHAMPLVIMRGAGEIRYKCRRVVWCNLAAEPSDFMPHGAVGLFTPRGAPLGKRNSSTGR